MSGWRERVLSAGTEWETTAYRCDAGGEGPSVAVVGGQHGIEPEGWEAAEMLLDLEPSSGTLVVIPRADPSAIDIGRYAGTLGGDMNGLWPETGEPGHDHVTECWEAVASADPDLVVDLHSSQGIYGQPGDGVGQALFPTPGATGWAGSVKDRLNDEMVTGHPDRFDFTMGNTLRAGRNGGKLARRALAHGSEAVILETARKRPTDFETRREWTLAGCAWLLGEAGMDVGYEP